ncbi:hypothetical protein RO04_11090 [Aggregatibacter actinomycetemcomitans]|uniref:Uncharacterized protein n=1 Tax=Aggregatibacter actinomycetemcomitans TaxID=714 RepID=A0AB74N3D6_AGGAC|nr:hypothetical protein RO04_11090 [Aggregatibacter actinomycetemcomitans]PHO19564.1 hypothetical protein CQR80_11590 [Aggregatibacter actinomycetemcomitans]PHO21802.1 hypothetical protein CQR79_11665 [Aggregatibacter actinomycetemcomitans]TYA20294.1 hypothetical protein FXE08_10740 [Aggregatibacter actinomycetemcomitans]TYA33993.1 hypothetical protein FXB68_10760 [Aggregatibacter actinomycetemcomitans]
MISLFSNPSNAIFANVGDIIPPCGVPSVVAFSRPNSIIPDFYHFLSIRLFIGMCFINQS